jgi:hypothetical protein
LRVFESRRRAGSFSVGISYTGMIQLTIPPSKAVPLGQTCPSFGQADISGDTYIAVIVGANGYTSPYSLVV